MTKATDNNTSSDREKQHEQAKLQIARQKKPGAQHRKMLKEALAGISDEAMAALLVNVKAGDSQALNIWANRVIPVQRSMMEPVQFKLPKSGTVLEKTEAVMQAIATGKLPPDIGVSMIQALGTVARIVETDELAKELAELKQMLGGLHESKA